AKYAAPIAATQRTYRHPETAGVQPRTYQLSPVAAVQLLSGDYDSLQADGLISQDGQTEPLTILNGRFVTEISVSYRGATEPLNLLTDSEISPVHSFAGPKEGRRVALNATSLAELSAS